ncbi:MAG: hypothetical protein SF052_01295 [Bacteroidia bacterium]|nr:hypothetical protein [Bacteroidia bacterium]
MKKSLLLLFLLLVVGGAGFAQTASDWPFNSRASVPGWLKNAQNPYETTGQMIIGAIESTRILSSTSRSTITDKNALLDAYMQRTGATTGDNTGLASRISSAQPTGFEPLLRQEGYSEKAIAYYRQINTAGSSTNLRQAITGIMQVETQIMADNTLTTGEEIMLLTTASSARYIEFYTAGLSAGLGATSNSQTYSLSLPDNNGDGVIDDQDALQAIPPSPTYPKLVKTFRTLSAQDGGFEPGVGNPEGGPPYLPLLPACGLNCEDK